MARIGAAYAMAVQETVNEIYDRYLKGLSRGNAEFIVGMLFGKVRGLP